MSNQTFISPNQTAKKLSLSRATVINYAKQQKHDFPKLYRITPKRLAFLLSDVEQWIDSRLTAKEA